MKLADFLDLDAPVLLPVQCRARKIMALRDRCREAAQNERQWPPDPIPANFNLTDHPAPLRAHELAFLAQRESEDAREGLGEAWNYIMNGIAFDLPIPDTAIIALKGACDINDLEMPRVFADD